MQLTARGATLSFRSLPVQPAAYALAAVPGFFSVNITLLVAGNDNWKDTQQADIQATGIPPTNNLESAIVETLSPGAYTAIVRGANDSTGVGLVEVYNLGP